MAEGKNEAGFTLIEALMALTILALAAGVAFKILSAGILQLERAKSEQEAVLLGESMLARVGPEIVVQPGHRAGTADGQEWSLDIGTSLFDPPPAHGLAAYPVRLAVRWRDDRGRQVLKLDSVRLGPEPLGP